MLGELGGLVQGDPGFPLAAAATFYLSDGGEDFCGETLGHLTRFRGERGGVKDHGRSYARPDCRSAASPEATNPTGDFSPPLHTGFNGLFIQFSAVIAISRQDHPGDDRVMFRAV